MAKLFSSISAKAFTFRREIPGELTLILVCVKIHLCQGCAGPVQIWDLPQGFIVFCNEGPGGLIMVNGLLEMVRICVS
jgi:hypothetical protein